MKNDKQTQTAYLRLLIAQLRALAQWEIERGDSAIPVIAEANTTVEEAADRLEEFYLNQFKDIKLSEDSLNAIVAKMLEVKGRGQ